MSINTWHAFAKLNLCLSVGAPNPAGADKPADKVGWHPIATWMQCIDLHDDVILRALPAGSPASISIRWADDAPRQTPIDWPIEQDLACRALRALEAHFARPLPVSIEVVKRIPVGSGLGGGSSDAGAVLVGVPRMLSLPISQEDLLRLALTLGSDVGFFADESARAAAPPNAAVISGFGELIERTDPAPAHILLIIPSYPCATAAVYKAFDDVLRERQSQDRAERAFRYLTGKDKDYGPRLSLVEARWSRAVERAKVEGDRLFNDLEVPAYRVEPRLGALSKALARATRETPCLTGSGSCLFFPTTVGKIDKLAERVSKLLEAVAGEDFGVGAKMLRTTLKS